MAHHHDRPFQCILPPHVMKRLSESASARTRAAAFDTARLSERLRGTRMALFEVLRAAVPTGQLRRSIYDAKQTERLPGQLVRSEGEAAVKDGAVNEAYDGLGYTYAYYAEAMGRISIDGQGQRLEASVHYGRDYMNAFWNGQQMVFGDGDGEVFGTFTPHVDVIAHELTHGVIQHEAAFEYHDQSGALNESFADVFGVQADQYRQKQDVKQASWLVGKGILVKFPRQAIRSLAAPGTAYDNDVLGKDPQPSHFKDYDPNAYPDDNGGVHIYSGIPNHAFYLAAMKLGGNSWEKAGKIWYLALTELLGRTAQFSDAALATVTAAGRISGTGAEKAVRDAWEAVGVSATSSTTAALRRRRAAPAARPAKVAAMRGKAAPRRKAS
jgi:Zn-dependent metalloprotease